MGKEERSSSSTKKLTIWLVIIGVVLLASIVAVIVVFAGGGSRVDTDFEVHYKASNVHANVKAEYTVGGVTKSIGAIDGATFESGDVSTAKYLSTDDHIYLDVYNPSVTFKYAFTNHSLEFKFKVSLTDKSVQDNVMIRYGAAKSGEQVHMGAMLGDITVGEGELWYVYITIEIADIDKDATYISSVESGLTWTLTGVENR